ncbi:restriction endonuclease subunit S [Streptococcus gordonii]|uniref:restriction endonuclease subunit S n=1 Tax=Streptococcus gordonii TaxID=1302 RepID=UPI0006B25129|nr:restriction endonuclease subunit S [Streptococcus gordonii]
MSSIRLGEIGKISMCKRILKSQTNEFSGIPFYKISTFGGTPTVYIDEKIYREYKEKYSYPKKGDILISAAGTIGKTVIFDGEDSYFQDSNIVWIENDESKVTNQFLYYFLQTNPFITTNGSTIKRLYNDNLRDTKIPNVPSIQQQNQITDILGALDKKIQINNQINQELEAMAKTLYDYWFVQFDFPDQNGKPYKSSGGKMVYNQELKREIPEGWGVTKVGELQIATGKRDANFGTENGKYDFWTTANSPIKADEFSFEGKAILIAGNGNFYVNFTEGKFEAYQRTYVIQSEDENMLIFMYMACLQSAEKLRKGSNGSIIKYITIGDVNNIVSPYNKKVVDEFVRIYSPLIDLIPKNKRQNQELTKLRDWLLPMLMNGQVKVE